MNVVASVSRTREFFRRAFVRFRDAGPTGAYEFLPGERAFPPVEMHTYRAAAILAQPVRMQLSRRKGFDLQAASFALNGLAAVNVARPGRYGNPWRVGLLDCVYCGLATTACTHGVNMYRRETAAECVALHRLWMREAHALPSLDAARGCNVACWCRLDEPCHGDTILEFANAVH